MSFVKDFQLCRLSGTSFGCRFQENVVTLARQNARILRLNEEIQGAKVSNIASEIAVENI